MRFLSQKANKQTNINGSKKIPTDFNFCRANEKNQTHKKKSFDVCRLK